MSTITARIPDETATLLEELAAATKRSKSFLVAEALQTYLEAQAWQVARTQDSLEQADKGQFASQEKVDEAFAKMGVKVD